MPEPVTVIGVGGGAIAFTTYLARRHFELAKEIMDVSLGFVALVFTLPVMALCALLIKLSDRGPVFFTQVRVGQKGKHFKMYKMRTMYVDAEKRSGAVWAGDNDPRIMPLCRWMRRSHADELPQLINVIKGEMSLVGPRPERPEILLQLEEKYPDVRRRLVVRPGITGLAQVRNGYDTTVEAFRAKLTSDLEYIERRGWGAEFSIMARTLTKLHDKAAR